jgi:hypothetical protein
MEVGKIVTLCLQIAPLILFVGSILAFFNLINVGPREMPRKHPLNRKMALPVFVVSVGMFLIPFSSPLDFVGLGLSIAGIAWYAVYFRKGRLEYPQMTDAEWLQAAKDRYGRMQDFDPKEDIQEETPDKIK